MVAALLAREDLERLPRRADGAEALLRGGERDLGVALAVNQQEGAPDSLRMASPLPGPSTIRQAMPRATRSGTPLKYWISFVTSKPSKTTRAGDRRAPPSA